MRQAGLFGLSDQLKRLSDCGDPLETMGRVVDFEVFRPALEKALAYGDGAKGGRPPYDPVAMFKVLILAAQNTVSDARMEFLIRDRLSWLRFLGFDLGAVDARREHDPAVPREADRAPARSTRCSPPSTGSCASAAICRWEVRSSMRRWWRHPSSATPRPRRTRSRRARARPRSGPTSPPKAAQKDTDARWTLKFAKARALPDGRPGIDIAIPSFGYKSSIAICRRYGFIRRGKVTDAARFDGRMLRDVVTNDNTASDVWADTAYRSRSNEAWLRSIGRVSRVHRKKPKGKPMPARTARANAARSTVRARIEHVFARQKDQMGLFIRTIGIARAEAKITLANLAYNIDRLIFHERRAAMG